MYKMLYLILLMGLKQDRGALYVTEETDPDVYQTLIKKEFQ